MQSSSSARRKTAFVPWLAALVIGATAHAGWLIHEYREPPTTEFSKHIEIHVDARPRVIETRPRMIDVRARELRARHTQPPARARSLPPSCRHASLDLRPSELELDLDLWIRQIERHRYTIDRRALERVALANYDVADLERLGVVARALGLAEPIELRNIQVGTPLFVLGLRTGDRLLAISTLSGEALEQVEVAIERRGRPIELVYELI